jgi:hypothetical protein
MKTRLALGMAPLGLFFAFAFAGVCLAQSAPPKAAASDTAVAARDTTDEETPVPPAPAPAAVEPVRVEPPAVPFLRTPDNGRIAGAPKPAGHSPFLKFGVAAKISSLGAGVEVAAPVIGKVNLRAGFNALRYSRNITDDGIRYDAQLRFQSGEAHLDWFFFRNFHVGPGVLFNNGNQVSGNASVPGGQPFTVGGTTYESDPSAPVTGFGKLYVSKVEPEITVGFGNLVPRERKHWSFLAEVGVAYQGAPQVGLNLGGNVCDTTGANCRAVSSDPTAQANIQAEQAKIQNDLSPFRFYPIVTLGVGFSF